MDFQAILSRKGIQHQSSVPYNLQQNSVAERFNRTLMDGARPIIAHAILRDKLWRDALLYTAWTINHVPHSSFKFIKVPTKGYG